MSGRMDASRFLDGLAACGWFEGLPDAAAEAARGQVAAVSAAGKDPWVGLVCACPDSSYLLEDEPYTELLRQFAHASHGTFVPEAIEEQRGKDAVRFSFRVAGREYSRSLPADAFDVPDSFFETINEAMRESGTPLRFVEIPDLGWGPIPGFALATPEAFQKAVSMRLLHHG
jgi:hypothetical protein